MYTKKLWIIGAAVASLSLTGCGQGLQGAPQDGDPVKVVDTRVDGPWQSDVMEAGPNGMEYKPVYTPRAYYASVEYGGGTYDIPVTENCYNNLRVGVQTNVASLKETCGDSLPSLVKRVP